MFLDDELLQICKEAKGLNTPEGIQQINKDIKDKCWKFYQGQVHIRMSRNEIKALLDRTFNLYSSFVRLAKKDSDKTINILSAMFEKYDFKTDFLKDPELKKLYESL